MPEPEWEKEWPNRKELFDRARTLSTEQREDAIHRLRQRAEEGDEEAGISCRDMEAVLIRAGFRVLGGEDAGE